MGLQEVQVGSTVECLQSTPVYHYRLNNPACLYAWFNQGIEHQLKNMIAYLETLCINTMSLNIYVMQAVILSGKKAQQKKKKKNR